jgi:hypothetical protein
VKGVERDRFNATVTGAPLTLRRDGLLGVMVDQDDGALVQAGCAAVLTGPRVLTEGRRVLVEAGRITETGGKA